MRLPLVEPPKGWRGFIADVAVVVFGVVLALIAQEFAQSIQGREMLQRNEVL